MGSKARSALFWIIFIIIVVILAITVLPKYGFLAKQLRHTEARNVATNLTAASAANYTQRKLNPTSGIPIKNCTNVGIILGNKLPPGFQIESKDLESDKMGSCVLKAPGGNIQFNVVGIN